ncbi:J domain-containing protein [Legionella worsleiensis]|uniref:J domain-containing protein n=1 Tax=Legionella worsleiensis TaxID=45076 RepID=A0A0W1A3V4_9GAMM|nr:J domain-containing protein [Legionella worsleiensis]KTD76045.1 hypothetical protein Lwor_2611 [Legionella worsleiensis]STY33060.1 Uncharacterised protein [Legionella worsleiensis]
MTLEAKLVSLVTHYAQFDDLRLGAAVGSDKHNLLSLERDFVNLVNQQLLTNGPTKEIIISKYRELSLKFHPDRHQDFSPEIRWIEHHLSEGRNDGACFKVLGSCRDKLINPQQFKELKFTDIKTTEDCMRWLEDLKNQADTFSGRSLYESLQGLLEQSSEFFDDADKIKPTSLRVLIKAIPIMFATYGSFIFVEELIAVYAIYFVVLKSGQYLESCESTELKSIGKTLQELSSVTATATTSLLTHLVEMIFWASHQCLDMSLQIGSSLLNSALCEPASSQDAEVNLHAEICRDMIMACQNMQEGMYFRTPQLKVISEPLESYMRSSSQQLFRGWRTGHDKYLAVDDFLFQMRVLDKGAESVDEKLDKAEKELVKIKANSRIYCDSMALAVDKAVLRLEYFKESDGADRQMVLFAPD